MRAYYNDNEPFVCEWTRNLMAAGHITQGTVDERSVTELTAADLVGYERVHLFSGLAGWEAALNLAGWRGPVWSASLPCPAFSCAGKSAGFADPRGQLWLPVLRLIRECRPVCVVGEQVPAAIRHGWIDRIFSDLEAENYACGACIVGAHSSGAPHRRQRIFWVAVAQGAGGRADAGTIPSGSLEGLRGAEGRDERRAIGEAGRACDSGADNGMADAQHAERRADVRRDGRDGLAHPDGGDERAQRQGQVSPPNIRPVERREQLGIGGRSADSGLDHAPSPRRDATQQGPEGEARHDARLRGPERGRSANGVLGHTDATRPQERQAHEQHADETAAVVAPSNISRLEHARSNRERQPEHAPEPSRDWAHDGLPRTPSAWDPSRFIPCADGKARRVPLEPAFQPLVDARDGARNRVGILRAAGNSVAVPTAATFLRVVMAL